MQWVEITIGIFVLTIGIYYWLTSTFDFWTSRGVPGSSPKLLFGNMFDVALGRITLAEYFKTEYQAHRDERMCGIFMKKKPALVLIDPDLIKDVLIRDFSTFPNRAVNITEDIDPLFDHLFNIEAPRWRPLRTKLSPIFSSGKLKKMFYLLVESGDSLEKYLAQLTLNNDTVECRELAAKYTIDVIGTCAFGLQTNALTDENSEFVKIGKEIFKTDWKVMVRTRLRDFAPWLYYLLKPLLVNWKIANFFLKTMRETVEYRKNNEIVKHDFIDLIMKLKDNPDKIDNIELTDLLLTCQLFVFFAAGFETSGTTLTNVLYELAKHQTIQDKLRDYINQALSESKGEITYEAIKSIKYLHMVIQETLRKYPSGPFLIRRSTERYSFPGTKVTIPKGTDVIVPVYGIHTDPRIYPKPDVFDPERFTDEAIKARHPMSWLAFGQGPRNCIGGRFAYYQMKVGLIKILQNYKVETCDKTQIPYVFDTQNLILMPAHDIYVKMTKLN